MIYSFVLWTWTVFFDDLTGRISKFEVGVDSVPLGTGDKYLTYYEMTRWDDVILFSNYGIISSILWFVHHVVELLNSRHISGKHLVSKRRIFAYTNIFAFLLNLKITRIMYLHPSFYTLPLIFYKSPLGIMDLTHRTETQVIYWGYQLCYQRIWIVSPQIWPSKSDYVSFEFFLFLYFKCYKAQIHCLWNENRLDQYMRYTTSQLHSLLGT